MVDNSPKNLGRKSADVFTPEIERIARTEAGARLIAKVLRDLLRERRFADPTAVKDALEDRCRELGMSFDRPQVERALDLVASNTQLFTANRRQDSKPAAAANPAPVMSHAEAKSVLDALGVRVSGGRLSNRATARTWLVEVK